MTSYIASFIFKDDAPSSISSEARMVNDFPLGGGMDDIKALRGLGVNLHAKKCINFHAEGFIFLTLILLRCNSVTETAV